jgi:hypothetical protein
VLLLAEEIEKGFSNLGRGHDVPTTNGHE